MDAILLRNAQFFTFNPHQPRADTMLIRDGKIDFVGMHDALHSTSALRAKEEDLGGAFVLPSFTDSHIHLLQYGLSLHRVNCQTSTRAECLARVRAWVEHAKSGEWVLGHGWNHNFWPEGIPNKALLDVFSNENPVYLTHKSLHCGLANSAALRAANINSTTPNPEGGLIEHDKQGDTTGILYESAMRLVESAIPPANNHQRLAALSEAQDLLLSLGITAVHDFDDWACYESLQSMEDEGILRLRVVKSIPYDKLEEAIAEGWRSGSGKERLKIGWLKLFSDGALGSHTAAMLDPYEDIASSGMLFLTKDEMVNIGKKAMAAGISLAIHAIGDRANREIINSYAQLKNEGYFPRSSLKPRIEHVQLITPEAQRLLAEIGITASMQPLHAMTDRDAAEQCWGSRCENAYAWQSLLKAGAFLIFGSDAPVESPNPYWGLVAAMTRAAPHLTHKQESWIPNQCVSLEAALNAYIPAPAEAAGLTSSGKLAKGCSADLAVFDKDLFRLPPEELAEVQPRAVMAEGKWVFNR